jgi:hypothetical protein
LEHAELIECRKGHSGPETASGAPSTQQKLLPLPSGPAAEMGSQKTHSGRAMKPSPPVFVSRYATRDHQFATPNEVNFVAVCWLEQGANIVKENDMPAFVIPVLSGIPVIVDDGYLTIRAIS